MVRQAQKEGQAKASSPEVARVACRIKKSDAKDFASTKHKGLPEKKKMNEEGYDHLRDQGRIPPTKGKKDATTMPRSYKPSSPRKGKSALEIVKKSITDKYGKGAIMNLKKEGTAYGIYKGDGKMKIGAKKKEDKNKQEVKAVPADTMEGMYDIDPKTGKSPVASSVEKGNKKKGDKRLRHFAKLAKKMVGEAKVDKGRSDYGKASIRNYRRMGPGHDDPGMFDPEGKRGKTIDKRREEHKARRGVKGAKVPAYKRESFERFVECWKTHKKVGMKMKGGKLVNDCRPKNEEVQVTEGSEKSYYLDKDAEKRAQQKARFKAQNKEAAKERAAAKRRKERNNLRRQGKYGAVGGYYVTKHMERESVELVDYLKKEAFNFSTNLYKKQQQEIYASKEEVSEESDQKSSESSILTFNEVTRLKKETGYVKGGTKKPTAPKQKDAALDFVKKSITAKYGKGAIMSGGSRQSKKVKGEKSTMGTGKYKKAADAKKQTAADAKKRGFKSTQDYANTMARYGGKDNYDKGRGLGT